MTETLPLLKLPTGTPGGSPLVFDPPEALAGCELVGFHGREAVSALFRFELEMLAPDEADLDVLADHTLGLGVTFGVAGAGGPRLFHGVIDDLAGDANGRVVVTVVPALYDLSLTADCKVFSGTVPEVVKRVLADHGVPAEWALTRDYRPREVCTQYRETALNFVLRLLEEEGVWFAFRHERGRHTLQFGDDPGAYFLGGVTAAAFRADGHEWAGAAGAVTSWSRHRGRRPGQYALGARHWPTPNAPLQHSAASTCPGAGAGEVYDWAEFTTPAEGKVYAELRMQEEESAHRVERGGGNHSGVAAGGLLKLIGGPGGTHWVVSVEHAARADATGRPYENRFTAVPAHVAFRPPRLTPRPAIAGVQSAVVVGPTGLPAAPGDASVHADKFGRVRVRMPWDRAGPAGAIWVRVAQPWAGRACGALFLPQVGQEVLVAYTEGDPDLPVVVGSVYHDPAGLPFDPRDLATVSGVRSGTRGRRRGNVLRMDDAEGDEELSLGAERDLRVHVRHDERVSVGVDSHCDIGGSRYERVGQDVHRTVSGDRTEKVAGKVASQVGGSRHEKVGAAFVLDCSGDVTIKSGGKLVLEAATQVSLVLGGNFVDIGPGGVSINGAMVRLNSGGAPAVGAASKLAEPTAPAMTPPRR